MDGQSPRFDLVSLGGWCRPAHNLRVYAGDDNRVRAGAHPFDWTITPFSALHACLDPGFDPDGVLGDDRLGVSFAKSGQCVQTGLIFHHALSAKHLGAQLRAPGETLQPEGALQGRVADTKGRFAHTWRRFAALRDSDAMPVFVRWRRAGAKDPRMAEVFAGEDDATLEAALQDFLGHAGFRVVVVESEILRDITEPLADPVTGLKRNGLTYTAHVQERMGYNGDQKPNFRGDEASWRALMDKVLAAIEAE